HGKPQHLRATLASVVGQIYPNWELCVAAPVELDSELRNILADASRQDSRIRVAYHAQLESDCAGCNLALQATQGEHVALLRTEDQLAEHALLAVARILATDERADMIYSD